MRLVWTAALAAALTGASALPSIARQTEVRWMHIEEDPAVVANLERIVAEFEAANPDVDVRMQFLANEAFKARLTTMLQSDERPHIFYTWGGGVMRAQADAGVLQDISAAVEGEWAESLSPGALEAYRYEGAIYGVPWEVNQVGFWHNRALFEEAGVDAEAIETWDDLLDAVRTFQEAGITPIATGGADKWPLHFYWTHLASRIGGKAAFDAAVAGEGEGFAAEPFVEAGERFMELVELEPFQPGFLAATFPEAAGHFGDGNAAMQLQGSWSRLTQRTNSQDGEGLSDEELGWFPFPVVEGGAGVATDTLGGINGWLISRDAPPEAVEFLRFMTNPENQTVAAAEGLHIPSTKGTSEALTNPFDQGFSRNLTASEYHQVFYDQDLGPAVGRVVNDAAVGLASGDLTPEEAAEQIQEAWEFETM